MAHKGAAEEEIAGCGAFKVKKDRTRLPVHSSPKKVNVKFGRK
jgi:hypothetical protein